MRAEHDVFDRREIHRHLKVLEGARNAAARQAFRRHPGDLLAAQANRAGARRVDAGDQIEQRGLAGAVGADHGVDRSLVDVETDLRNRGDAAEALGQVLDPQHGQESLRQSRAPRLGAIPRGRKIIVATRMAPNAIVS